ncbi:MAG: hypothetical protein LBT74_05845 [Acidobacteriota bacterium]|jgi:exo-beta-1,3-glucanase (GH17 family)|nr:hypothetical protein [Acidobacteriota bacterium]
MKNIRIVLCIFVACGALLAGVAARAGDAAGQGAYIAIDSVPRIGGGGYVEGHVGFADGKGGDPADYAISMAVEVTRGGRKFGPKPTYDNPAVDVRPDGTFSCLFVSGGQDAAAERLHVYLLRRGAAPGSVAAAEAAALDTVVIDRYSDGEAKISQRSGKALSAAPPAADAGTPRAAPAAWRKHPKADPRLSICFSPYTNGLSPEDDSEVPVEEMRRQLDLLRPYVDTIRMFGVSGTLEKAYRMAKEEYGLRVIAGAWFDKSYGEEKIHAELDKLIDLANKGYVDVAVVGSETLHRGDFSASELAGYIGRVRRGIKDGGIPVGTSDTVESWLGNPSLVQASDVVLVTIYPFFSNVPAARGLSHVKSAYAQVEKAAAGRPVIVSESGWPTEGGAEGLAVPGMANAKRLFEDTYSWSRANDVEVVMFSAMDEAWKVEGASGDVGRHWGHFTADGRLKDAFAPVYRSIATVPLGKMGGAVGGTLTAEAFSASGARLDGWYDEYAEVALGGGYSALTIGKVGFSVAHKGVDPKGCVGVYALGGGVRRKKLEPEVRKDGSLMFDVKGVEAVRIESLSPSIPYVPYSEEIRLFDVALHR